MKIKNGYLYWADLGVPRGPEPGKVRPVLVVQTDHLNRLHHGTTISLVGTSKIRAESLTRNHLTRGLAGNKEPTDILIDQIRSVATDAYVEEIGQVPAVVMKDIRRKLALILNLDLKI